MQLKWISMKDTIVLRESKNNEMCKSYILLIMEWLSKAEQLRNINTSTVETGLEPTLNCLRLSEVKLK